MKLAVILKTVIALLMLFYVVLAGAQVYTPDTPVVASGQMPLYPDLARQAQIQGTVQVNVTTDGNVITKMTASGAHTWLLQAAEQNVRTWRLYRHKPQTFIVTFVYKLEPPDAYGPVNPTVLLELPSHVEVRTKAPMATD